MVTPRRKNPPYISKGNYNPTKEDKILKQVLAKEGLASSDVQIIDEEDLDYDAMTKRLKEADKQRIIKDNYYKKQAMSEGRDKYASEGSGVATGVADISMGQSDFYSPWLSTDYLELPRSFSEERRWYRFFYDQDPLVGRVVDLRTYIPISKIRLTRPKCRDHETAQKILSFYELVLRRCKFYQKVFEIVHEWNLLGEVFIYFDWDDKTKTYSKIILLDPDICEVQVFPFSDEQNISIIPDQSLKQYLESMKDNEGWETTALELEEYLDKNEDEEAKFELETDPTKGSFVKYLARRRSPYKPGPGVSILRRILRDLLFRDKLRQAQTQIASRRMTPTRVVWAEEISEDQVEDLRSQVDLALLGPDFSIITNYEVHWDEYGVSDRLFDVSSHNEDAMNRILIGLGVTKDMVLGEGSYGQGRIALALMDTEYMYLRDSIQDMFEEIFRQIAKANDFVEEDEFGVKHLIYPSIRFTRLPLRDYADIYEQLFNLYQMGSLDLETLLELLNIDADDVKEKVQKDMFTIADSKANDFIRALYEGSVDEVRDKTNVIERIVKGFGLELKQTETPAPSSEEEKSYTEETSDQPIEGETPAESTSELPALPNTPEEKELPPEKTLAPEEVEVLTPEEEAKVEKKEKEEEVKMPKVKKTPTPEK